MSTNEISKPVEDSNTEGNKIKEFETGSCTSLVKKRVNQMPYGIPYGSLSTIEATYSKLVCYFTPRSSHFTL